MNFIFYSIFYILFIFLIYFIFIKIYNIKKRELIFRRFSELLVLYDLAKENSYDQLFLSTISPNFASGYKIRNDEVPNLQKEFIKAVKTFLGISIWEDIEFIKGDINSITNELAFYLITRLTQDEKLYSNKELENEFGEEFLDNINNEFFPTTSMIKDIETQ